MNEPVSWSKTLVGVLALSVFFIGGLFLGMFLKNASVPVNATLACPSYGCERKEVSSPVEVVSAKQASGRGNILGTNPIISVSVKNPSNIGVEAKARISCKTLQKPLTTLESEQAYLKPGETKTFSLEYEIGNEDWSCDDFTAIAQMVTGCELRQTS